TGGLSPGPCRPSARGAVRAGDSARPALPCGVVQSLARLALQRRRRDPAGEPRCRRHVSIPVPLPARGAPVGDLLQGIEGQAIWLLFFATPVYGHVALKVAVDRASGDTRQAIRAAVASGWGWSACSAWCLSCLLWAAALSKCPLMQANALSSLR